MTEPLKRGEALHNPFDLEDDGTNWAGLNNPRSDGKLLWFKTDFDGLRGGAVDLHTSWKRRGPTLEPIIRRFAPPSENNTPAYIAAVEKELGIEPNSPLALNDLPTLCRLMEAIIRQEQGRVIYPAILIAEAAKAALGQEEQAPMPTQLPQLSAGHVATGTGGSMLLIKPIEYLASCFHAPPMDDTTALGFGAIVVWAAVLWAARKGQTLPPLNGTGETGAPVPAN